MYGGVTGNAGDRLPMSIPFDIYTYQPDIKNIPSLRSLPLLTIALIQKATGPLGNPWPDHQFKFV
jgi:hypothetical protein